MATDIVSTLLSDPPAVPQPKDRPVDEDYAKTVKAGYVETLEAFGARIDENRVRILTGLALAASLLLLALGRRIQTGGHHA